MKRSIWKKKWIKISQSLITYHLRWEVCAVFVYSASVLLLCVVNSSDIPSRIYIYLLLFSLRNWHYQNYTGTNREYVRWSRNLAPSQLIKRLCCKHTCCLAKLSSLFSQLAGNKHIYIYIYSIYNVNVTKNMLQYVHRAIPAISVFYGIYPECRKAQLQTTVVQVNTKAAPWLQNRSVKKQGVLHRRKHCHCTWDPRSTSLNECRWKKFSPPFTVE